LTFYEPLTKTEISEVEKMLDNLLNSNITADIIKEKVLIKIMGKRNEVYLISPSDITFFDYVSSNPTLRECNVVHAKIKMGFLIHEKFFVGIESLTFLAPFTHRKIFLSEQETKRFIYGKDIKVANTPLSVQISDLEENTMVIVFSPNEIPLGYARIRSKANNLWVQNVVDIGIYIRSEKSAF
jgi:ribosome biogenesis protein Nip4